MKYVHVGIIVLLVLLSLAAGAAKLFQVPEEREFLMSLGFSQGAILVFGAMQVLGAVLIAIFATRTYGALLTFLLLSLSAVLVAMSGNVMFALVSALPAALSVTVFIRHQRLVKMANS